MSKKINKMNEELKKLRILDNMSTTVIQGKNKVIFKMTAKKTVKYDIPTRKKFVDDILTNEKIIQLASELAWIKEKYNGNSLRIRVI